MRVLGPGESGGGELDHASVPGGGRPGRGGPAGGLGRGRRRFTLKLCMADEQLWSSIVQKWSQGTIPPRKGFVGYIL